MWHNQQSLLCLVIERVHDALLTLSLRFVGTDVDPLRKMWAWILTAPGSGAASGKRSGLYIVSQYQTTSLGASTV